MWSDCSLDCWVERLKLLWNFINVIDCVPFLVQLDLVMMKFVLQSLLSGCIGYFAQNSLCFACFGRFISIYIDVFHFRDLLQSYFLLLNSISCCYSRKCYQNRAGLLSVWSLRWRRFLNSISAFFFKVILYWFNKVTIHPDILWPLPVNIMKLR